MTRLRARERAARKAAAHIHGRRGRPAHDRAGDIPGCARPGAPVAPAGVAATAAGGTCGTPCGGSPAAVTDAGSVRQWKEVCTAARPGTGLNRPDLGQEKDQKPHHYQRPSVPTLRLTRFVVLV